MYPLRQMRPLVAAIALTSAVTFSGCAATNVSSYLPSQADVTRYRTYGWAAADRFETGDPRLDNNPFFQDRVQAAVERELAGRGLEKVTTGPAALIVYYHLTVKQRVNAIKTEEANGYCEQCTPYVDDADTLVIDLVDARSEKLVWRGWAEGSVVIDNQQVLEKQIDKAVASILARLPKLS